MRKTRLRTLQRGRQPALQRLGRGRLVVTRMPAAPPVEAVLLVHAGQRCQHGHGQPQVGTINQRGRGRRASSLPRWMADGTWIFRLAGMYYDYYVHYDEPILEDRPDFQRQLQLRAHWRATAAAACPPNRVVLVHPSPPMGGDPRCPQTTRRKSACRTMTAPSSCCRECGAGVGPTDRVIIQSLRPLSRPSPRRRAAARMMTTTTTTHDDAW